MFERFLKKISSFRIRLIDTNQKLVIVEDKGMGLVIDIPYGPKILKKAEIVSQYEIQLFYEDGSSRTTKVLN